MPFVMCRVRVAAFAVPAYRNTIDCQHWHRCLQTPSSVYNHSLYSRRIAAITGGPAPNPNGRKKNSHVQQTTGALMNGRAKKKECSRVPKKVTDGGIHRNESVPTRIVAAGLTTKREAHIQHCCAWRLVPFCSIDFSIINTSHRRSLIFHKQQNRDFCRRTNENEGKTSSGAPVRLALLRLALHARKWFIGRYCDVKPYCVSHLRCLRFNRLALGRQTSG